MLVDTEDYLSDTEIVKLREDIETKQLSLIVVADWYNKEKIDSKKYFNIVTFEDWHLFMGGSNGPTYNELLKPYHIAFGQSVASGMFKVEDKLIDIISGTEIIHFPQGGYLISP